MKIVLESHKDVRCNGEVHVLATIIPQNYAICCLEKRTRKTACRMLIFIRKGAHKKEKVFVFLKFFLVALFFGKEVEKGEEAQRRQKGLFLCVREEKKQKQKLSIFKVMYVTSYGWELQIFLRCLFR